MSADLAGKNILITGCSRGLGSVIAETMWREGANLLMISRSRDGLGRLQERLRGSVAERQSAHIFCADLADRSAPAQIGAEARRLWPHIDVLVNNAAITGPVGALIDNDWALWRESLQVNLLAPAELTRFAVGWMKDTGRCGSVINISGGGATSARPCFSAYATAKCGLVRFSETIAVESRDLKIRVNCVAPGAMNTEILREALCAGPERMGTEEYEKMLKVASRAAAADPQVAADLVAYLASDRAARITGRLISAVWDPWRKIHEHLEQLNATDIYTLRRIVPEDRGKTWEAHA